MTISFLRLVGGYLFATNLTLVGVPASHANDESPRGEITSRSCKAITNQWQIQQDIIPFTAAFGSDTYKVKEGMELFITTEDDAYVTIIDQGSNPTENRNKTWYKNEKLVAGEKRRFPAEGYKLTVNPPTGTNTFEILISREKLEDKLPAKDENSRDVELEKLPEKKAEPFRCIMAFEIID